MRAAPSLVEGLLTVLVAVAAAGAPACSRAVEPSSAPTIATPAVQSSGDDVVIGREQVGTTVTVKVGQVIRIHRPSDTSWRLDYAPEVLTMLTPEEQVANPGPDGWRLRAEAPGETDVMVTMAGPAGGSPNVMRLTYTIKVEPR